mgnify:CR=1 FL=1
MVLGALIDLGVPLEEVRRALGGLAIAHDVVWTERVLRAGVSATRFCVRGEGVGHTHGDAHGHHHPHQHEHDHHHHHHGEVAGHHHYHPHTHPHRTLAEIAHLVDHSSLSPAAKRRTKDLFHRLGEAEARIHNMPLEQVHLHEVGALDSIIDIAGAVFAMEYLGADRVVSSPLNLGHGSIRSAHGVYPVPAPATLRLLEGVPVYAGPQESELVTPTGALLISAYASSYGQVPPMRMRAVGYGAGSKDFPERPNVLRVVLGDDVATTVLSDVLVLEAEIDDMSPQVFGTLMDGLLADGALDVFYTSVQMKKNRPGTLLTVIARPEDRERHAARIFRETTTIGLRQQIVARECLERELVSVDTAFGEVRVKVARRGGEIMNAAPEFEDCVRLAGQAGQPLKNVQSAAMKEIGRAHV